jgi:adhesin HecA-like repeat protein
MLHRNLELRIAEIIVNTAGGIGGTGYVSVTPLFFAVFHEKDS